MAISRAESPTLSEEEALDAADPLRHFRSDGATEQEPASVAAPLLPTQPHSIRNEIQQLTFPISRKGSPEIGIDASSSVAIAIKLAVDASPGCGGIAWPAGEVLARHISRHSHGNDQLSSSVSSPLKGFNVLELGSGTGLVGLVAALLGARHVWITDQRPLLPIMQRNIELNQLEGRITATELNWGEPLPQDIPRPHLILAADCVYFEPAFPLLVQTLADLVPQVCAEGEDDPEVLFCYKKRRKADKRFFALLKKYFTYTDVEDPDHTIFTRESISLLRLRRKR